MQKPDERIEHFELPFICKQQHSLHVVSFFGQRVLWGSSDFRRGRRRVLFSSSRQACPFRCYEHVDALALALAVSDLGLGRVLIAPALAGLSYFIHKTAYGQILVQDPNKVYENLILTDLLHQHVT